MEWKVPLHTPARGPGRCMGNWTAMCSQCLLLSPLPQVTSRVSSLPQPSCRLPRSHWASWNAHRSPSPLPCPSLHLLLTHLPGAPALLGNTSASPAALARASGPDSCWLAAPAPQPLTRSHTAGAENMPEDQLCPDTVPGQKQAQPELSARLRLSLASPKGKTSSHSWGAGGQPSWHCPPWAGGHDHGHLLQGKAGWPSSGTSTR